MSFPESARRITRIPPVIVLVLFTFLLIVLSLWSLGVGPVAVPFSAWFRGILGWGDELRSSEQTILWSLRLPRVVATILVGAALATSGVGFQSLFRNPLADPYIIGASSGAALGVAMSIVFGWHWSALGIGTNAWVAMIGSVLSVSLVLGVGRLASVGSVYALLLAGIALSCITNAMVSLLLFMHDEKAIVVLSWLMGSFANSTWSLVRGVSVPIFIGCTIVGLSTRKMDAFLLGDTVSASLGLRVQRFHATIILGAGMATAGSVALAGIIGFVGLLAPQIARMLVGINHRWMLPTSACIGAMLMVLADSIARSVVAPTELPVGIVTALLGAPCFLTLLVIKRRGALSS